MSTQISKEAFEYLNKLRANPQIAIPKLQERLKYFKGNKLCLPNEIPLITNEGIKAFDECIQFLKAQKPLNKLEYSEYLEKPCQDHVNDIGPKGISGHSGSDGSSLSDRIERYGDWMGKIGENISFGQHTGEDVILQLIVDDGVLSRGHRTNCFGPDFNLVGIADGQHKQYKTCCVMDLAGEITPKNQEGQQKKDGGDQMKNLKHQMQTQQFQNNHQNVDQQMKNLTHKMEAQTIQDGEPDYVSKNVSTQVSIKNGKKHTKVTTVYKMANGSTQTQIQETFEG